MNRRVCQYALATLVFLGACGRSVASQLESKDEQVRLTAVRSLASSTNGDDVSRLIRVLQTDDSALVREHAASALGHMLGRTRYGGEPKQPQVSVEGHPEALQALAVRLRTDEEDLVRESCASALRVIGSPEVLGDLEAVVKADPSKNVRHAAIRAITAMPAPQNVATLLRLLEALADRADNAEGGVDVFALTDVTMGLQSMGHAAAPGLLPLLEASNWRVRRYAIEGLYDARSERVRQSLELLVTSDPHPQVRSWAEMALERYPSKPAPPPK